MLDDEDRTTTHQPRAREAIIGAGVVWLSRWTLRWIIVVIGAVLLGWVVSQLWSILLPLLLALILTTVLEPPARWLEVRLRLSPALAALGAILGTLAVVAVVIMFIAPSVGSQVEEIALSASDGLSEIERWVQDSDLDVTQTQVDAVVQAAQERLRSSASSIASGVLVGVGAITSALINLLLTLVLSFFFLKDGRRFLPWLKDLTGSHAGDHLVEVSQRTWTTLSQFVRTQALVGLIDGTLIGIGLLVVGVPLALPLAVLTFVAAFAPIIGAITIGVVAVLVALVANGWVAALVILGIVVLVQQLEGNLLLPWLQGKSLNLHAGVVLLTIVLGSTLFGVAGAFLGVPAVAVLAVVLRYVNELITARAFVPDPAPDPAPDATPDDARESPEQTR